MEGRGWGGILDVNGQCWEDIVLLRMETLAHGMRRENGRDSDGLIVL
jgi:hypothetical protein